MTENMKKFMELVSADQELGVKVSAAEKDALIAIAKENGIELTEADFAAPAGELSDDELDMVVGGAQQETVQLAPGSRYYRCRNCGAQVATKQSCPVCKRYTWAVVDCRDSASVTLYV